MLANEVLSQDSQVFKIFPKCIIAASGANERSLSADRIHFSISTILRLPQPQVRSVQNVMVPDHWSIFVPVVVPLHVNAIVPPPDARCNFKASILK